MELSKPILAKFGQTQIFKPNFHYNMFIILIYAIIIKLHVLYKFYNSYIFVNKALFVRID